jgi:hypothetical protein
VTAVDRLSPSARKTPYLEKARRLEWAEVRAAALARWWIAAAIAIALFTWPYPSIAASSGIDESWAIALHLAAARGLDFGQEILFTYGPLGFLSQPLLVTTGTAFAAFAFALVLQCALCALVLRSTLRTFPAPIAVLLTFGAVAILAATGFSNLGDYIPVIVFLLAVNALRERAPSLWLVPLGGALAALQLLVKLNGGVLCLVLLALVVWRCSPGGWRSEALLALTFLASFVLLWLASGSSLGAIPSWLRLSFHVVVSYTNAMAVDLPREESVLAVFLLLAAAVLVVAHARHLGRLRGTAFAAVCFVFGFGYLKEGFIRPDEFHVTLFFGALALGLLAVRWGSEVRWGAAVLVVASLGAAAATVSSSRFLFDVGPHAGNTLEQARILLDGSQRHGTYLSSIAEARERLRIDEGTLDLLRGHTVDVHPYEASAVWAYDLSWRPQLFIQSYMATDHALDVANAHHLATDGAERILRQLDAPGLDGKHPLFMAPESSLVLACRYRQLRRSGNWETLGRGDDRCGRPRRLRSVEAESGEIVPVPQAANEIVYARLQSDLTFRQRIRSLLLKPLPLPRIKLDGAPYRLVSDTARGPLILKLPSTAGVSRLVVENVASPYRIDFYALPLKKA